MVTDATTASAAQSSAVTASTALQNAAQTNASSTQLATDFSDFLTLLTTQLQNQDPLAPMDSTEFTNQLVSFAGVEQQINANQKLDNLVSLSVGNAFSSALSYVGKNAKYASSEFNYDGTNPVEINYAINGTPASSSIHIYDSDGNLLHTQTLAAGSGTDSYTWDGMTDQGTQAPSGTYQIKIDALDSNNKSLDSSTVVSGHVRGIETQNGAIYLLVGDRAVSVSQVINVNEVASTDSSNTSDTSSTDTSS